jgi:hypothetical protein
MFHAVEEFALVYLDTGMILFYESDLKPDSMP